MPSRPVRDSSIEGLISTYELDPECNESMQWARQVNGEAIYAKEHGLPPHRKGAVWSPEWKAHMCDLYTQGFTVAQIAERIGSKDETVRAHLLNAKLLESAATEVSSEETNVVSRPRRTRQEDQRAQQSDETENSESEVSSYSRDNESSSDESTGCGKKRKRTRAQSFSAPIVGQARNVNITVMNRADSQSNVRAPQQHNRGLLACVEDETYGSSQTVQADYGSNAVYTSDVGESIRVRQQSSRKTSGQLYDSAIGMSFDKGSSNRRPEAGNDAEAARVNQASSSASACLAQRRRRTSRSGPEPTPSRQRQRPALSSGEDSERRREGEVADLSARRTETHYAARGRQTVRRDEQTPRGNKRARDRSSSREDPEEEARLMEGFGLGTGRGRTNSRARPRMTRAPEMTATESDAYLMSGALPAPPSLKQNARPGNQTNRVTFGSAVLRSISRSRDHGRRPQMTLEPLKRHHVDELWQNLNHERHPGMFDHFSPYRPRSADDLWRRYAANAQHCFAVRYVSRRLRNAGLPHPERDDSVHGVIGGIPEGEHRDSFKITSLFAPALQNTRAGTEAHYRVLKHIFDPPATSALTPAASAFWRCNAEDYAAVRAGLRLGFYDFSSEADKNSMGVKRLTLILTHIDWPLAHQALQTWLDDKNFDDNGMQKQPLTALTHAYKPQRPSLKEIDDQQEDEEPLDHHEDGDRSLVYSSPLATIRYERD